MTVQYNYHFGEVGDDMSLPSMETRESVKQGNFLGNYVGETAKPKTSKFII